MENITLKEQLYMTESISNAKAIKQVLICMTGSLGSILISRQFPENVYTHSLFVAAGILGFVGGQVFKDTLANIEKLEQIFNNSEVEIRCIDYIMNLNPNLQTKLFLMARRWLVKGDLYKKN